MHGTADLTSIASGIVADDQVAYSVPQVAKLLDIRERLAWELCKKDGPIKSFKIGSLRRVARQDLLAYVEQQRDAA